jgi:hypothetical protein
MTALNLQVNNLTAGANINLETSAVPGGVLNLTAVPPNSKTNVNTAVTATTGTTLAATALLSGLITRSGPTAAFTDTTATAALIQAAWQAGAGASFDFTIINTTDFNETLAGGTGVTLAGEKIIPANSTGSFLATWTGTNTITVTSREVVSDIALPPVQYQTLNATTGSLPAGAITGAQMCFLLSTNATPGAQLVRSAAQMLNDIPNGAVGSSWFVRILNSGAGTLTLTADAGATVTISGTATVPTTTFRDFVFTITAAATATAQSVGSGVQP